MKNMLDTTILGDVNAGQYEPRLWAYIKWKKIENIDIKIQELYINFALLLQD